MNLLDDVYFFHREEQKWKPSFVISVINDGKSRDIFSNRYLVAGYGPSLHHNHVITEDQYITCVDSKTLDTLTQLALRTK